MAARVVWHGPAVEKRIRSEGSKRVRRAIVECRSQTQRNISRPSRGFRSDGRRSGSFTGEFPTANRGQLLRAIFEAMTGELEGIFGVDSSSPAAKYAKRLEEGGVIRSHGRLMAVPVSPEAKAHSFNGGPRSFNKPLVRIRRRGKPPLLVEIPPGSKGNRMWIIHYVLTPSVTIGARPYISRTLNEMMPRIKQIFEAPWPL